MPEWLLWGIGIAIFLFTLCVSVALHEGGHAIAANKLGVRVKDFFVGFGPKVWGRTTKRGMNYGFRGIPLGGFVRLVDERFEAKSYEALSLSRIHPWRRIVIFVAGPLVNIVLGFLLIFGGVMAVPYDKPSNVVNVVLPCDESLGWFEEETCGAFEAGLKQGDEILTADGTNVKWSEDLAPVLAGKDSVTLKIKRGEETLEQEVPLVGSSMGVLLDTEKTHRNFAEAGAFVKGIFDNTIATIMDIPETAPSVVTSIATGERDEKAPGSVVVAGKSYGEMTVVADEMQVSMFDRIIDYLLIGGLLNLSIGLINLVPILPLDGGRILVALIDWAKMGVSKVSKKEYKPIGKKVFVTASITSSVVVIGFMVILMVSDFSLIIRGVI